MNEAVLGGVLHGLRIPVTGLLVGSTAVLLICLMGYYGNRRSEILKATLIVCIIKAMLSPHTPLPAYLAVLFQGGVGALLVSGKGVFTLRCVAFAVLALLESALQKLVMLTILFGMEFWEAVDQFVSKILSPFGLQNEPYSQFLVVGYLSIHVLAGLGIGLLAGKLPILIQRYSSQNGQHLQLILGNIDVQNQPKKSPRKGVKPLLILVWLMLTTLLLQAWLQPANPWLPAGDVLVLIIRSVVLLLAWYLLIGPILLRLFKKWLEKKQSVLKSEVQAVLTLMPVTLNLAQSCWQKSSTEKGFGRLRVFILLLTVSLFSTDTSNEPA